MGRDYRVVVVTPAGRERYLRVLARHVLASPVVDEWHLWINTTVPGDLGFIAALGRHERVRLVEPPRHPPDGNRTIGQFFRTSTERDTLYVRLDDDIVYLEPDFFTRLLVERLRDPGPLMLYPAIINNAMVTWLLRKLGLLDLPLTPGGPAGVGPSCTDPVGWADAGFAEALHRWFLGLVRRGELDAIRFDGVSTGLARFSINAMAWLGDALREVDGEFPDGEDEEEYASVTLPMLMGRPNRITGRAIAAHFAFFTQREALDATDLLARYAEIAPVLALPS